MAGRSPTQIVRIDVSASDRILANPPRKVVVAVDQRGLTENPFGACEVLIRRCRLALAAEGLSADEGEKESTRDKGLVDMPRKESRQRKSHGNWNGNRWRGLARAGWTSTAEPDQGSNIGPGGESSSSTASILSASRTTRRIG